MNLNLKPGDHCWVRNWKHQIVPAEYCSSISRKYHQVIADGILCVASRFKPEPEKQYRNIYVRPLVRFVLINREVK